MQSQTYKKMKVANILSKGCFGISGDIFFESDLRKIN